MNTIGAVQTATFIFSHYRVILQISKISLLIAGIASLIILVRILFLWMKNRQSCWMTSRAKKELRKDLSFNRRFQLYFEEHNFYYPSISGTVLVISMGIVWFIILLGLETWFSKLTTLYNPDFFAYFQIFSAIIFGLFIFLTENSKKPDTLRALLRYSKIYPVFLISILFYALMLLPKVLSDGKSYTPGYTLFSLFVSLITLIPIYRILRAFLIPHVMHTAITNLAKDSMNSAMEYQFTKRIITNNLADSLKRASVPNLTIEFSPFNLERDVYEHISPFKNSESITDINIYELNGFVEELKSKNITQNSNVTLQNNQNELPNNAPDHPNVPKNLKVIFTSSLGDRVNGKEPLLLIPTELCSVFNKKYLEKRLKKIYKTREQNEYVEQDLLRSIQEAQDAAFIAIEKDLENAFDASLDTFDTIIEAFLEGLQTYFGSGYSLHDARSEMGSIFDRAWKFLHEINKSYLKILDRIVQKQARNSFNILINHLAKYLQLSIKYKDNYIFGLFSQSLGRYYAILNSDVNEISKKANIKSLIINWKQTVDYYLIYAFHEISVDDAQKYAELITQALGSINYILRRCVSSKDYETYGQVIGILGKIRKKFDRDDRLPVEKQNIIDGINAKIDELIFGITSWVLHKYRSSDYGESYHTMLEIGKGKLPTEFSRIYEIYLKCDTFRTEWGWDDLESEDMDFDDGEPSVHTYDFDTKLNWLFVIKALDSLRTGADVHDISTRIPITMDEDIIHRVDTLTNIAREIDSNSKLKEALVPGLSTTTVTKFGELLELRKQAQITAEEQKVIEAVIDANIVESFRDEFYKTFNEETTLRLLFKKNNSFEIIEDKESELYWGINKLEKKEMYSNAESAKQMGSFFGRELAGEEDKHITKLLVNEVINEIPLEAEVLLNKIATLVQNTKSPILVVTFWMDSISEILNKAGLSYKPKYLCEDNRYNKLPDYSGELTYGNSKIPVIHLPSFDTNEDYLVGFDASCFVLQQYDIGINENEVFKIEVIDLAHDDAMRTKLIDKGDDWLTNQADPDYYLKQLIIIKVLEKYKLLAKSTDNNFKITLHDDTL